MILLIDTREVKPLPFEPGGPITAVRQQALEVGDYTAQFADGVIPPVRFERKGFGDLYGTMTGGYPRFKQEMAKARALHLDLLLLIEGSLADVAEGYTHSRFSGASMVQKLFTVMVRHKIPTVFCRTRQEMMCYIEEYLLAIGREYVALQRVKRKGTKGGDAVVLTGGAEA